MVESFEVVRRDKYDVEAWRDVLERLREDVEEAIPRQARWLRRKAREEEAKRLRRRPSSSGSRRDEEEAGDSKAAEAGDDAGEKDSAEGRDPGNGGGVGDDNTKMEVEGQSAAASSGASSSSSSAGASSGGGGGGEGREEAEEEVDFPELARARRYHEQFFEMFPTASLEWVKYIQLEMAVRHVADPAHPRAWVERVRALLKRCMFRCLHIRVWETYLSFVLESESGNIPEIVKAYEFAVDHVGVDIDSGNIWADYIQLYKDLETDGQHRMEQKRLQDLRRLYQLAVENATHKTESLWRAYDGFENQLDKNTARSILQRHSPKYVAARSLYRERVVLEKDLDKGYLGSKVERMTKQDQEQLSRWRRLIAWERGDPNPMHDGGQHMLKRVEYLYRQAVGSFRLYPSMWLEYIDFLKGTNASLERIKACFEQALEALPHCLLLHFEYAHGLAEHKKLKEAGKVYKRLRKQDPSNALVALQHMRFAWRTEGSKKGRKIFSSFRKSPHCTHHLYVASALFEYHHNNEPEIARKVFESGLKAFDNDVALVMEYIRFLWNLNDIRNARGLFERALESLPLDQCRELWRLFLQFECACGDLDSISSVQQRMLQALPDASAASSSSSSGGGGAAAAGGGVRPRDAARAVSLVSVVERYRWGDLWPVSAATVRSFFDDPAVLQEGRADDLSLGASSRYSAFLHAEAADGGTGGGSGSLLGPSALNALEALSVVSSAGFDVSASGTGGPNSNQAAKQMRRLRQILTQRQIGELSKVRRPNVSLLVPYTASMHVLTPQTMGVDVAAVASEISLGRVPDGAPAMGNASPSLRPAPRAINFVSVAGAAGRKRPADGGDASTSEEELTLEDIPVILMEVLASLPPPQSYQGPAPQLDWLLERLRHLQLPSEYEERCQSEAHAIRRRKASRLAPDPSSSASSSSSSSGHASAASGGPPSKRQKIDDVPAGSRDIWRDRQAKKLNLM